jgi:hypothetical protein
VPSEPSCRQSRRAVRAFVPSEVRGGQIQDRPCRQAPKAEPRNVLTRPLQIDHSLLLRHPPQTRFRPPLRHPRPHPLWVNHNTPLFSLRTPGPAARHIPHPHPLRHISFPPPPTHPPPSPSDTRGHIPYKSTTAPHPSAFAAGFAPGPAARGSRRRLGEGPEARGRDT